MPAVLTRAVCPELAVVVPCYNEVANAPVLVARLAKAVAGVDWEVIFVDDNSPDGTSAVVRELAQHDPRVRCLRRIGRRGLSSAVIEGALSTSAPYVAVMDGDLQHDETRLPIMLDALRQGRADLVVGSRHVEGGDSGGLASRRRHALSDGGTWLAQMVLRVPLSDPMSGFFALPRPLFERLAPHLNGHGFKILLDLVLAAPRSLRVQEVPFRFGERWAGESKMDPLVLVQFAGLLLDKTLRGAVPMRFIGFALVGALGVLVNLAITMVARRSGVAFTDAQLVGTVAAIIANFWLNNTLTYRTSRLRGARMWRGLVLFMVVCLLGATANVGIAQSLYSDHSGLILSSVAGAIVGVVWNYAISATLVWSAAA